MDAESVQHGFLFNGRVFTNVDFPGAIATVAYGINTSGEIVGVYYDSAGAHGFLLKKKAYSSINFPHASDTYVFGINDAGATAGEYQDASGATHGFTHSGGVFNRVDVPGAALTSLRPHQERRQRGRCCDRQPQRGPWRDRPLVGSLGDQRTTDNLRRSYMTRTLLQSVAILAIAFFAGQSCLLSAQAAPAERGREIQGEFGLRRSLGLPLNSLGAAQQTATAGSGLDAIALGLARKKSYHFRSVDYPGSQYSLVLDFNDETAVGQFAYPISSVAFYFRGHVLPPDQHHGWR